MPAPPGVAAALLALGQLCFWASILLAVWARESIGLHWAHAADFQIVPGQDLVTDGPYRYVRHPLYLSLFLVFLSAELSVASYGIVLALPLLWFMGWQARKEDLLLARHFGELYADYASRTGRFLPRFGSRV
jgi:protein-S-isoprenylcysteine O-methyltransferase Ste14